MNAPTSKQLKILIDRAARHLTADEGAMLRAGVEDLQSTRRSVGGVTEENRRLKSELLDLRRRVEPVEAAVAAVAVKAHEWAGLAPVDDWGSGPHDAVLADTGRYLIQLMAQPALAAAATLEPAERSA